MYPIGPSVWGYHQKVWTQTSIGTMLPVNSKSVGQKLEHPTDYLLPGKINVNTKKISGRGLLI